MSHPAPQLVQKLWNYCNILPPSPSLRRTGRDDGLSYGDYVEQLIPPARDWFLKMADEQARPPFNKPSPIVAEVERRLSVVEELESVVTANLLRATRLRQSILQKAFSGKLTAR